MDTHTHTPALFPDNLLEKCSTKDLDSINRFKSDKCYRIPSQLPSEPTPHCTPKGFSIIINKNKKKQQNAPHNFKSTWGIQEYQVRTFASALNLFALWTLWKESRESARDVAENISCAHKGTAVSTHGPRKAEEAELKSKRLRWKLNS